VQLTENHFKVECINSSSLATLLMSPGNVDIARLDPQSILARSVLSRLPLDLIQFGVQIDAVEPNTSPACAFGVCVKCFFFFNFFDTWIILFY